MSSQDNRSIRIRGGQHHRYHEAIEKGYLKLRGELLLTRDPENAYDPRAIKVSVRGPNETEFLDVGYVAAEQAKHFYWRLDRGAVIMRCTVTRLDEKKHAIDAYLQLQGGWKKLIEEPKMMPSEIHPDDDIPF